MEDGFFFVVRLDGPTSIIQFFKKSTYKAFGPLNQILDQEEWPCTKKWMSWIFWYGSKKGSLGKKIEFDHSLVFSWLHLSSLLVRCVEDVACKIFTTMYTNQMSNLICTCSMQSTCDMYLYVVHWALWATRFLSRGRVCFDQCPGIFLGIIYQDPSVSKCNQFHVNIFITIFVNWRLWKISK